MPDPAGASDPTPIDLARERLVRAAQVRERLAELVGRAESTDGLIKIACTAADPLHELQLHPRALKQLNTTLVEAIQQTAAAARADLKQQADDVMAEEYGDDNPSRLARDPAAASSRLREMTETLTAAGQNAQAVIDELRSRLGG